jgi:hypothetical protein
MEEDDTENHSAFSVQRSAFASSTRFSVSSHHPPSHGIGNGRIEEPNVAENRKSVATELAQCEIPDPDPHHADSSYMQANSK